MRGQWTICISLLLHAAAHAASPIASPPLADIRAAFNGTPVEVVKALGKPDAGVNQTTDCGDETSKSCLQATYQSGRVHVEFDRGLAKGFSIYQKDLFGKNIPEMLGFPGAAPTWDGEIEKGWRIAGHQEKGTGPALSAPGIDDIELLKGKGKPDELLINVSFKYNRRYN
jgi:hypothetical protein